MKLKTCSLFDNMKSKKKKKKKKETGMLSANCANVEFDNCLPKPKKNRHKVKTQWVTNAQRVSHELYFLYDLETSVTSVTRIFLCSLFVILFFDAFFDIFFSLFFVNLCVETTWFQLSKRARSQILNDGHRHYYSCRYQRDCQCSAALNAFGFWLRF